MKYDAGGGRYAKYVEYVRTRTEAKAVALVVLSGNKGHGMGVQLALPSTMPVSLVAQLWEDLATALELLAANLRADAAELRQRTQD